MIPTALVATIEGHEGNLNNYPFTKNNFAAELTLAKEHYLVFQQQAGVQIYKCRGRDYREQGV